MAAHEKTHPYHMVEPSPWPVVGALAALTLATGAVFYFHGEPLWFIAPGFTLLLITFYGWWRDVVREANSGKYHTEEVRHGLRMGMLLFIASEVMFFFAFFWAYFHASVPFLSKVAATQWPPKGIIPMETWDIPFLNTLILLSSGVTVTYAHHAIQLGDHKRCANGLLLTIILGIIFTSCQAYEYVHAAFHLSTDIYSSTFFLATGFHGAHVIIGTCFLTVCFFRVRRGDFTPRQHVGFEAAAWYWHFVDVVWLFLFTWVYWWGSSGFDFSKVHGG